MKGPRICGSRSTWEQVSAVRARRAGARPGQMASGTSETFLHQDQIVPASGFPPDLRQARNLDVAQRGVEGDACHVLARHPGKKRMDAARSQIVLDRYHQRSPQPPALRFGDQVDRVLERMRIARSTT